MEAKLRTETELDRIGQAAALDGTLELSEMPRTRKIRLAEFGWTSWAQRLAANLDERC